MRLLFDHVEKCGGRSVVKHLKEVYGDDIDTLDGDNQHIAIEQSSKGKLKACVAGHGSHYLIPFATGYTTAVVLREPVDRVVSLYRYCKQEGHFAKDGNIEQFLNDFAVARNYYTWRFAGMIPAHITDCPTLAMRRALRAIMAYDRIGFTEDIAGFITSLNTGLPYSDAIENKTNYQEAISDSDLELIQKANELDQKVYSAVKQSK